MQRTRQTAVNRQPAPNSGMMMTMNGNDSKRLERKLSGRWLAGVCAGLADYFAVDATLIRVIFLVCSLFAALGPVVYVVAWVLIPEEGESASIVEKFMNKDGA
jgi:phage shock protein C